MDAAGGIAESIPHDDFQKWRAVVDLDGDSWSSRFGSLLCSNSVVLKVEPRHVEYFYDSLKPWEHYIPVSRDLSNLEEIVDRYVVSDDNLAVTRGIIENAQQWCRTNWVRRAHAEKLLDSLTFYVEKLNEESPEWQEVWRQRKSDYFSETSKAMMQEVQR
jgi:hypothetical protein